jgi:helix-hairpin-helix protein
LTLASARALANAGVLTVEDLKSENSLELAMIPRIGAKSLAILYELKGEKVPDVAVLYGKAKHLRSILSLGNGVPAATSGKSAN